MKKRILFVATILCASLALGQTTFQVRQTRPIQLGTSGGNVNDASRSFCCSGTLGSLVTKGGVQYILSNNHVLARSDSATVGEAISQPGLIDSSCRVTSADTVANFSQAIKLGNNVDAALAQVVSGDVSSNGAILSVGVPASTTATPTVSRGVAKAGRTTGFTCGSIGSVNTNVSVQYQAGCNSGKKFTISYTNQVVINSSTFSAGGDSGSLIVTSDTAQPVALLFAGSSTTTIGNPIGDVVKALGITFVGGATHSLSCTAAAGAIGSKGKGLSEGELHRALTAKEGHWPELFNDAAIQGVGVGEHPDFPGEGAVIIYVEQGRAHGPIPAEIDGVKTVVVVTDRFRATGWNEPTQPASCSSK